MTGGHASGWEKPVKVTDPCQVPDKYHLTKATAEMTGAGFEPTNSFGDRLISSASRHAKICAIQVPIA